jgi:hypothetical protein
VYDHLAEIRTQDFLNHLTEKIGESSFVPCNSQFAITVHSLVAVNYVIQTLLCYWAPRQPGPMYYLHGSQPQPMTNGFITNPLSLTNPVAPARARRTIIDRLWLITANSPRRLKCKLGPEEHDH